MPQVWQQTSWKVTSIWDCQLVSLKFRYKIPFPKTRSGLLFTEYILRRELYMLVIRRGQTLVLFWKGEKIRCRNTQKTALHVFIALQGSLFSYVDKYICYFICQWWPCTLAQTLGLLPLQWRAHACIRWEDRIRAGSISSFFALCLDFLQTKTHPRHVHTLHDWAVHLTVQLHHPHYSLQEAGEVSI